MSTTEPIETQPADRGDDVRLMGAVARGEPRAFDAIVLRYSGELLRYGRRLGLSEQSAEDVLQQSLLKAWVALEAGTEVQSLRPWLYRIVHNNAVNALTRQREVPSTLDRELGEGGLPHLDRVVEMRAALADVAALPEMQREAMLMSAVGGESHEDVARALGVTDGAVRGLLHRARQTLRAAAAALVPPQVTGWLGGAASRLTPYAGRAAETTPSLEFSGEIAKGAAVAAAAAVLVAGAAIEHHVAAGRPDGDARPALVARAGTPVVLAAARRSTGASSQSAAGGDRVGAASGANSPATKRGGQVHEVTAGAGHERPAGGSTNTHTVSGASGEAPVRQHTVEGAREESRSERGGASHDEGGSHTVSGGGAGGSDGRSGGGEGQHEGESDQHGETHEGESDQHGEHPGLTEGAAGRGDNFEPPAGKS